MAKISRSLRSSSEIKLDKAGEDKVSHDAKIREAIRERLPGVVSEKQMIAGDGKTKIPIKAVNEYQFVFREQEEQASQQGEGGEGEDQQQQGQGQGKGQQQQQQQLPQLGQGEPEEEEGEEESLAGTPEMEDQSEAEEQKGAGEREEIEAVQETEDQQKFQGEKEEQFYQARPRAGDRPGEEYFDAEVSLDDLREALYEDFDLLNLKESFEATIDVKERKKPKGHRLVGPWAQLDRKETARQKTKRQIVLKKKGKKLPFDENDLRYKRKKEDKRKANAVIFCIRDISGSMDVGKQFLVQAFFIFMVDLLRKRYPLIDIRFIVHHTEALEIKNEVHFIKARSSGGTHCSSGFTKVMEIAKEEYDPNLWNTYVFYCSDGENLESDDRIVLNAATELCEIAQFVGFGQTKGDKRSELLLNLFKDKLSRLDNLAVAPIETKEDIKKAILQFVEQENLLARKRGGNR